MAHNHENCTVYNCDKGMMFGPCYEDCPDDEWGAAMTRRLGQWLKWDHVEARPPIHRWMGMSPDGFITWRETGHIPRETRILWTLFLEELDA